MTTGLSGDSPLTPFQLLQQVVEDVFVTLQLQTAVGIGEQGIGTRVVEDVEGALGVDVEALGQQGYDAALLAPLIKGTVPVIFQQQNLWKDGDPF